ncbi:MAG TPA: thioredoxin domain-containing protein [Longimicrobium sp.]|nr:thioredoxin domain-containing protein [Longimicrobium sp.]
MQRERLLTGAVVLMGVAALVTTAFVLRRELTASRPEPVDVRPRQVKGWERYLEPGHRVGPANAAVAIIEFSDFQCVYCRQHAEHLARLRRAHPRDVAIVFRHFPVTERHPHAYQAALATECAREQGAFEPYRAALFRGQASIGRASWLHFAREAAVPDTVDFARCMEDDRHGRRIARDLADGRRLGIPATPTSLINGLKVVGAVEEQVAAAVRDALSGAGGARP